MRKDKLNRIKCGEYILYNYTIWRITALLFKSVRLTNIQKTNEIFVSEKKLLKKEFIFLSIK